MVTLKKVIFNSRKKYQQVEFIKIEAHCPIPRSEWQIAHASRPPWGANNIGRGTDLICRILTL